MDASGNQGYMYTSCTVDDPEPYSLLIVHFHELRRGMFTLFCHQSPLYSARQQHACPITFAASPSKTWQTTLAHRKRQKHGAYRTNLFDGRQEIFINRPAAQIAYHCRFQNSNNINITTSFHNLPPVSLTLSDASVTGAQSPRVVWTSPFCIG